MTELHTVLKETKLQVTFNSPYSMKQLPWEKSTLPLTTFPVQEQCVETLAEAHFPPLTSDTAALAMGGSAGSCSTPRPEKPQ